MTEIEAVFWDIGGVILDVESVRAGHERFVAWLVEEFDLDGGTDEALDTWRTAVGEHFREREGTEFRAARDAYGLAVEAVVGESLSRDRWHPHFREEIRAVIRTNPGAEKTIARLAETNYHQGVVSDADTDEARLILESFGLLSHFDAVTTSEEVGRTKPDPAMFETALDRAGVAPEQALMIGDRYEHDVVGANRIGIRTAGYGSGAVPDDASEGSAPDYLLDDLRDVLAILGIESNAVDD